MKKTYTFHVSGIHCSSCKIFIEDTLNKQSGIDRVDVDLKNKTVLIDTTVNENPYKLAKALTKKIKDNGYILSVEKKIKEKNKEDVIWQALPIGLGFLTIFFLLQKSKILNFGLGGEISPLTSFIIGLIASTSSCLAIVGGLVLSLSAKIVKDKVNNRKVFILFHLGRLISFAILGGVLGAIGNAISINFTFTTILGILASIVMLLLGLNLVGVFEKNKVVLPVSLFNFLRRIEHKTLTPFILGLATFFLPCGFTQSMQIQALSSGSFILGLVIMLTFALGTLPMLLLLSFGFASFAHRKNTSLFFKSAGIVVIGLGLFSLLAGLAQLGIINPLFNI